MQQRIISLVIGNLVQPLKYLICVQDSVPNFYPKRKIMQIVIFRIVFFYLNQQNPEKNEKFEIFASFNKKVIFEAKKIVSTTCQTRLNIFSLNPFWFTDKRKQN